MDLGWRGTERAAVEELIRAKGLDKVVFTVFRRVCGDMSANLGRFDYYVHPAIAEGMPYAVVEAMAAGLPVVATDVGGTSELIERGVSGIVIPPADPEVLASSVLQLLDNPEYARGLGAAAPERIRRHFPEKTMAEAEDRLIRQTLNGRAS